MEKLSGALLANSVNLRPRFYVRVKFRVNLIFAKVDLKTIDFEADAGPFIQEVINRVIRLVVGRGDANLAVHELGIPTMVIVPDSHGLYIEYRP